MTGLEKPLQNLSPVFTAFPGEHHKAAQTKKRQQNIDDGCPESGKES